MSLEVIIYVPGSLFFQKIRRESDLELQVHLALLLGLRRGEVLGLRFQDVDFETEHLNQLPVS